MYLDDTLSRAYLPEEGGEIEFDLIYSTTGITSSRMEAIRSATMQDKAM